MKAEKSPGVQILHPKELEQSQMLFWPVGSQKMCKYYIQIKH